MRAFSTTNSRGSKKKTLSAALPRLQRMLLQLQQYTFTLIYKPGKDMTLADILSSAYLDIDSTSQNLNEDLVCAVSSVINNLPISDPKLETIQLACTSDTTIINLQSTIIAVCSENQSEILQELRPYWSFCDELSTAEGIVFKGENEVVIPHSLRKEMLLIGQDPHSNLLSFQCLYPFPARTKHLSHISYFSLYLDVL